MQKKLMLTRVQLLTAVVSFGIAKPFIFLALQPAKRSRPLILIGHNFDRMLEIKSHLAKDRPPLMKEEAWKRMEGGSDWPHGHLDARAGGSELGLRGPDGPRPDLAQQPYFWPLLPL